MKNAQLWKRILHEGIYSEGTPAEQRHRAITQILQATIIVDTRELPVRDFRNDSIHEFKGIALPLERFWLEGTKIGAVAFGSIMRVEIRDGIRELHGVSILNAAGTPPETIGGFVLKVDAGGGPVNLQVNVSPAIASRNDPEKVVAIMNGCVYSILDTLQMLSCKNVSLSPRDNDPKQVRIATKRHGPSSTGYRYHVLTVRPPGAKSESEAVDIGTMPRHVCRGHFAEYGPEFGKGLLFGKLAGRFFIPPHLKGDKKNGIVEKDYEIPAA